MKESPLNPRRKEPLYPNPAVSLAPGGILSPMKVGSAGLEVTVSYLSMKAGDVIALKFNGDDRLAPIEVGTQTAVSFWVPVSYVAAALGQTVAVQYTIGGTGGGGSSEILQLSILPFMEGDLPMSEIIGASPSTPGELDLGIVEGNPVFRIPPWPLISAGQTVWLDLKYSAPSSVLYPVIQGKKVTTTEASEGITYPVPRTELERVTHGTVIELEFMVDFSGAAIPDKAISFPELQLVVLQKGQGETEFTEDFEDCPVGEFSVTLATKHLCFEGDANPARHHSIISTEIGKAISLETGSGAVVMTFKDELKPSHVSFDLKIVSSSSPSTSTCLVTCYSSETPASIEVPIGPSTPILHFREDITHITFIRKLNGGLGSAFLTVIIDNIRWGLGETKTR